jgi:hypothetical protein
MTMPDNYETQRKRIIKGRNRMLALVLLALVVLFYLITFAKFGPQ